MKNSKIVFPMWERRTREAFLAEIKEALGDCFVAETDCRDDRIELKFGDGQKFLLTVAEGTEGETE